MFSYYGSKSKVINLYPAPRYGKIIEPFAGSARYALKYWDRDVLLVDKYEIVVKIWRYLQRCSPQDIIGLPSLGTGQSLDSFRFDCIEAKWLMGFLIKSGVESPRLTVSSYRDIEYIDDQKRDIASQLSKIKNWTIRLGDYRECQNEQATWFIDPPYQFGGRYYKQGNYDIDYSALSEWCKSRIGQVIVCENSKANWLPFYPAKGMRGQLHKTTEAVWYNDIEQGAFQWTI